MRRALITGITGQDGRHLANHLLENGYEVFGLIHGQGQEKLEELRQQQPQVKAIQSDLSDASSIISALQVSEPDEIYNLAALSHVGVSFIQPELTANITGLGILRILEACRALKIDSQVKIYQASSSEMFGKVRETPQSEETPFHPRSPYGVAKTFAHYIGVNYREAYGMFVCNGILFNHEGEFRAPEFVTRKITQAVARIKLRKQNELRLGSLTPQRDWGYAGDYVKAMHLMLQQSEPEDYVIATGETHSVREFVELAFDLAEIDDGLERFVIQDPTLLRPSEVDLLVGDSTKAKEKLGWKPLIDFKGLVALMLKNDLILESKKFELAIPKTQVT
jgi:GDPmannose 4,6-dehydratase